MKLILTNREQIGALGSYLVSEFDSIIARIRGAWGVEHNDDDTHGNVHSQSIATGRLTFSDIATDTISATTRLDNYEPAGLTTASLLRLNTTLAVVDITGIKVPQDETGTVIDGRVLAIENVSVNSPFRIFNENTNSLQRNRIVIPWLPAGTESELQWFYLMPGSILFLIYNATKARWVLHGQTNDAVSMTATFGSSQNDYTPSGFRSSKYISLGATAANLTISGFDGRTTTGTTNIPYPTTKIITNDGLYTFDILHMNTGSVAANRVACPGSVRYRVYPRESVTIYRSAADTWKIAEKADQWIDVVYAAGDFTASAGNWTVDSADVETLAYHLDGNKMTVAFNIINTDVSAAPVSLKIKIPNSRTAARTMLTAPAVVIDAGTAFYSGLAKVTAGGTVIEFFKDAAGTAWTTTAADNTAVYGEITFMVRDDCASITEAHSDVAHADAAHADVEHSDVAHSDVAHGDSHSDSSHTDIAHSDVAHTDVAHSDTPHSDAAHSDGAHDDVAHSDVAHSDVAFVDVAHSDIDHDDGTSHTDDGGDPNNPPNHTDHVDSPHSDVAHNDVAHSDVSHSDVAHVDNAHADSAHSDVTHVDVAHSDVAHSDSAHVDAGHTDSHSDTAPHSDVTHVDVAHSDTVHGDAAHADVGYHCDTAHADV